MPDPGELSARALVSRGDVARLQHVMAKARRGEKVTIGVIGGSITQGASASKPENRYGERVAQWWREAFAQAQVEFVNAGIGATGSNYGCLRVQPHLLKHNPDLPDMADRWASFSTPKMAAAALDGPAQVKVGEAAPFDVSVAGKDGAPYAAADVKLVKYLLYDATGAVVTVGEATAAGDGKYQITLGADVTAKLAAGSDKIEVAVVPIPVAIPAYASLDFVVVP